MQFSRGKTRSKNGSLTTKANIDMTENTLGIPEQVSFEEFKKLFSEAVWPTITEQWLRPAVHTLVCFSNIDMSSSHFGERTCMSLGPDCTYKSVKEIEGQHLGDTPSTFKYPTHYCVNGGVGYMGRKYTDSQRHMAQQAIARFASFREVCCQLETSLNAIDASADDEIKKICIQIEKADDLTLRDLDNLLERIISKTLR